MTDLTASLKVAKTEAPLADRMRPRTLNEFIGQDHIIGPGRLLRRAIEADQLSSLIFYGPPGTGKTTLARIIANTTRAHFIAINAVLAGVKEIRAAIDIAQEKRARHSQRTILFIDEVHRFNKSQQDALLPWVENGMVILIGATTENPYFEVNKALVSRSRIFQLKQLNENDLHHVVEQTLLDLERGYGKLAVQIEPDALAHLVNVANGDARSLLNALELAVETTPPDTAGVIRVTLAVAEESIQQRAVLYDKEGDAHFDTISAFIKSLRGSDPDAALYWLARMVYAGEDSRFISRRMLILASEDVGLADPNAVLAAQTSGVLFDHRIIGRNALVRESSQVKTAQLLAKLLRQSGVLVLAETVPRHTQRLYHLLEPTKLDADLYQRLVVAEEAIYTDDSDPMVNWDADELRVAIVAKGLFVEVTTERSSTQMHVTPALLERWFSPTAATKERPTYAQRLARFLEEAEVRTVQNLFTRSLLHQTVTWSSTVAFVRATAE